MNANNIRESLAIRVKGKLIIQYSAKFQPINSKGTVAKRLNRGINFIPSD